MCRGSATKGRGKSVRRGTHKDIRLVRHHELILPALTTALAARSPAITAATAAASRRRVILAGAGIAAATAASNLCTTPYHLQHSAVGLAMEEGAPPRDDN